MVKKNSSHHPVSVVLMTGVVVGTLEMGIYTSSVFLIILATFATFPLYFLAYRLGPKLALCSVAIATAVGLLVFFLSPQASAQTTFLKPLLVTPAKLMMPCLVMYLLGPAITSATVSRALNAAGYWGLAMVMMVMAIYEVTMGLDTLMTAIMKLPEQLQSIPGFTEGSLKNGGQKKMMQLMMQMAQLLPGLDILDFLKSQVFQLVLALSFLSARWPAQTQKGRRAKAPFPALLGALGRIKIDRFWGALCVGAIVALVVQPTPVITYFAVNAIMVIAFLFLMNGSDIVYQLCVRKKLRGMTIGVIFMLSYVFGWPLLVFLGIGLVDQFYALRRTS